jgi:thiamine pyrophosphate-dependent acetolactate synthase large subunit-like protein
VILILDCDVPWIPARNPPGKNAKIYHIDVDPLNQQIPISFFPAHGRWKSDSYVALDQVLRHLNQEFSVTLQDPKYANRETELVKSHSARLDALAKLPRMGDSDSLEGHNIGRLFKECLPEDMTFVVEAITCSHLIADQLQPSRPGQLDQLRRHRHRMEQWRCFRSEDGFGR